MLVCIFLLFSGPSFLNIAVMSPAFSSFGSWLFLIDILIQFCKSLQICMFASLTMLE